MGLEGIGVLQHNLHSRQIVKEKLSRSRASSRRAYAAIPLTLLFLTALLEFPGSATAGATCSGSGPYTVTWDGGAGTNRWEDGDNWNPNGEPGRVGEPIDDQICIPESAAVVMTASAGVESHLISIDSEGVLTVDVGGKLFLHGAEPSYMATFRLRAGTLGGRGTVTITDAFEWTSLPVGPATQTTRPLEHISVNDPLTGTPGKTIIASSADLKINGPLAHAYDPSASDGPFGCEGAPCGGVNFRDNRIIENHGLTTLSKGGFLAADWGTTFRNMATGKFVIENDRGYYQGFAEPETERSFFKNAGLVRKSITSSADGPGVASVIDATYEEIGEGQIEVRMGSLNILTSLGTRKAKVVRGATIGTGACPARTAVCDNPSATSSDKEITVVKPSPNSKKSSITIVEKSVIGPTPIGEKVTVRATPLIGGGGGAVTTVLSIDKSELQGIEQARDVRMRLDGDRIPRCDGGPGKVSPKPACLESLRIKSKGDLRIKTLVSEVSLRHGGTFIARRFR